MLLLDLMHYLYNYIWMFVLRHTLLNLFKYTHIADRADQTHDQIGTDRNSCRPKANVTP